MLRMCALTASLLIGTGTFPALALLPDDTMTDWSHASDSDRSAVLDALGPTLSHDYGTEKPDLLACLNQIGRDSPHGGLAIREIARACAAIVEHRDLDESPRTSPIKA